MMPSHLDLSVIIPLYNEEESIEPLYAKLIAALSSLHKSYEIIFINDGSSDRSYDILSQLAARDKNLKLIQLRRNFGQTAAMSAGFDHARDRKSTRLNSSHGGISRMPSSA